MRTNKVFLDILRGLIFLCIIGFPSVSFAETDVTDKILLNKGRLLYDRLTTQSYLDVSLTNFSGEVFLSPIKVVIDSVSPDTVKVANADGCTQDGKPYFEYNTNNGQLLAGQTTSLKKWAFANPTLARFSYTVRVLGVIPEAFGEIGLEGGVVVSSGGAQLSIPAGSLQSNTEVRLLDVPVTDLDINLPPEFSILYAVALDLDGAKLEFEAVLSIAAQSSDSAPVILAQVLDSEGLMRLILVDTTSIDPDGRLHTNSPPFPGVLSGGTYIFVVMPEGLGILGITVSSQEGLPVENALVSLITNSIPSGVAEVAVEHALEFQSNFVGLTDSNGFTAIPGVIAGATITAMAAINGPTPSQHLIGVSGITLPTNISLPPNLADRISTQITNYFNVDLPQPPEPCPSPILSVDPYQVGVSPDVFEIGQTRNLQVIYGSYDVTSSTSFDEADVTNILIDCLSIGCCVNFTSYYSLDDGVATVSNDGVITAVSPGDTTIAIWSDIYSLTSFDEKLYWQTCIASGGVDPVVVKSDSHVLTVFVDGLGVGKLKVDDLECGSGCSIMYLDGAFATLTATAETGSVFTGWSGDCNGTETTITIPMSADKSCQANFDPISWVEIDHTKTSFGDGRCAETILFSNVPINATSNYNICMRYLRVMPPYIGPAGALLIITAGPNAHIGPDGVSCVMDSNIPLSVQTDLLNKLNYLPTPTTIYQPDPRDIAVRWDDPSPNSIEINLKSFNKQVDLGCSP